MLFAINYSPQAADLFANGMIQVDRFKCPDWPGMIDEASRYCPVAVHFELKAGGGHLYKTDWKRIHQLLEQTGTPYVNLHLGPTLKDFPGMPVDTPEPDQFEKVVEKLLKDIRIAVNECGADKVIVENVPYRGQGGKALRPAVETAVIRRLVEETGCGFLMDISHARIAAHHLGIDERIYMAELPVKRLRELHFTGLHNLDDRLHDHLEILDADWPPLDWVLERIRSGQWARPWLLAFEYGGVGEKFAWRSDSKIIADQAPKLYKRVSAV